MLIRLQQAARSSIFLQLSSAIRGCPWTALSSLSVVGNVYTVTMQSLQTHGALQMHAQGSYSTTMAWCKKALFDSYLTAILRFLAVFSQM